MTAVERDPVQPGGERGIEAQLARFPQHSQEDVLRDFFGRAGITRETQGTRVHAAAMPAQQAPQCSRISGCGCLQERTVLVYSQRSLVTLRAVSGWCVDDEVALRRTEIEQAQVRAPHLCGLRHAQVLHVAVRPVDHDVRRERNALTGIGAEVAVGRVHEGEAALTRRAEPSGPIAVAHGRTEFGHRLSLGAQLLQQKEERIQRVHAARFIATRNQTLSIRTALHDAAVTNAALHCLLIAALAQHPDAGALGNDGWRRRARQSNLLSTTHTHGRLQRLRRTVLSLDRSGRTENQGQR